MKNEIVPRTRDLHIVGPCHARILMNIVVSIDLIHFPVHIHQGGFWQVTLLGMECVITPRWWIGVWGVTPPGVFGAGLE